MHWGNYEVVTVDGWLEAIEPAAYEVDPSPIGLGMLDAHSAPIRITRPMVRKGWLEHGLQRDANNRGAQPFVPLPWDEAVGPDAQAMLF